MLFVPQIRLLLTIVDVCKLYSLTYLPVCAVVDWGARWLVEIRKSVGESAARIHAANRLLWSRGARRERKGEMGRHTGTYFIHRYLLGTLNDVFFLFQSVCWYLCELGFLLGMFLSFPSVGSGVLGQLSLASLRGRRIEYQLCWGKGGDVTSAGWQVTLCDPTWHVSSRSCVATLRSAIHLLLTYLLG